MSGTTTRAPSPRPVTAWPTAELADAPFGAGDRILLVSAHPDDETIGAGRLVADQRGEVGAMTLTAGEHCVPELDAGAMGERRLREWRAAAAALGVDRLLEPGGARWPDGLLADHEEEIAATLGVVAARYDVIVTTWRHDPHPDHEAAGRAAATAAAAVGVRLVEYPVWAPYWTPFETVAGRGYRAARVAASATADAARDRALAAYASQTQPAAPGCAPVVPAGMLARHPHQILMVSA